MTNAKPVRLNIGCGRNILPAAEGWLNLDCKALPGVDIVCDLNGLDSLDQARRIPLPDGTVDEIVASHVIEHIPNVLPMMQELYRVAKPEATLTVRVPYGSSDDAWEDPTHVRAYFVGSWGYFAQPTYWRADYGYTGDWQPEVVRLRVPKDIVERGHKDIHARIMSMRNVVREMVAILRKVSPARPAQRQLIVHPRIEIAPI